MTITKNDRELDPKQQTNGFKDKSITRLVNLNLSEINLKKIENLRIMKHRSLKQLATQEF